MELQQLQYFIKAAQLGGFTRAAEACYVSQPTLSQAIAKLEQELGKPLFERLGRRVQLTPAGEILLQRAQQAHGLLEDARERIATSGEEGRLVVGAIPTIAPYLLPGVITQFAERYPNASIELQEDVTKRLIAACRSAEIDLAILALPLDEPRLHVEPLWDEPLLLVLPREHPLEQREHIALDDLRDFPFVLLHEAHCLTGNITSFCQQQQLQPVSSERAAQLVTVQELVTLGHGLSLIPAMARAVDHDPRRVYRQLADPQPCRTLAAVWREGKYYSGLMGKFVDMLRRAKPA